MDVVVWVDAWQHQCCGDGLQLGSKVRWAVRHDDHPHEWVDRLMGPEWAAKVHFTEDHHAGPTDGVLTGVVSEINVVTCARISETIEEPGARGTRLVPIRGSGKLRRVEIASPWEPETLDPGAGITFDGWIVHVTSAKFQ